MGLLLWNVSTGLIMARSVQRARSPWRRIAGLLARPTIAADEGLLFERCSAIHTIGMRSAIDVIFLDRLHRIEHIEAGVTPGRGHVARRSAAHVLEMGPGFIAANDVAIGDRLALEAAPVQP
jgi:uncharacterized protein